MTEESTVPLGAIIERRLTEMLAPTHLRVINESDAHIGHAGHDGSGESHFAVEIVAEQFEGMARVGRHRVINTLLAGLFEGKLHALRIDAKTPDEFAQKPR